MDLWHRQKADSQLINALIAHVKRHCISPVTSAGTWRDVAPLCFGCEQNYPPWRLFNQVKCMNRVGIADIWLRIKQTRCSCRCPDLRPQCVQAGPLL
jgi:hypothetical protein